MIMLPAGRAISMRANEDKESRLKSFRRVVLGDSFLSIVFGLSVLISCCSLCWPRTWESSCTMCGSRYLCCKTTMEIFRKAVVLVRGIVDITPSGASDWFCVLGR